MPVAVQIGETFAKMDKENQFLDFMELETRTYFLANACHVCKTKNTSYGCEICKMVFYCSSEHRRKDWYEHSKICWAVNKICVEENVTYLYQLFNCNSSTDFRHEIAEKCIRVLERGLLPWEMEMLYYPRFCRVCFEFDWEKLQQCKYCEFIFTCEKRHFPKDHSKWCKILKIYSEIIIAQSQKNNICGKNLDNIEIKIGNHKSMYELVKKIFITNRNTQHSLALDVKKALISELLTYPTTVLDSLNFLHLTNKSEITVLFIGAETQAEVEPRKKWENYLLHELKNTTLLKLIFLGPELQVNDCDCLITLCDSCRTQNKELRADFISGKFYHEHFFSQNVKFDLICAMNSGMYRNFGFKSENSWEETILKLFTFGRAPVLITEYTYHEIRRDLEKLKKLCGPISVINPLRVNPFASMKPGLNIISENDSPVIFKNYYCILLGSKKKEFYG